jgi:membrane associated rhomboid family serine protease
VGHTIANQGDALPVVGASGAISGVMGAYLVFRPRGRVLTIVTSAAFQVVYIPAWTVLGLFFVTQFFTPEDAGVAWVAHAAGMAAGALLGLVLARIFRDPDWRPAPERPEPVWTLPEAPPVH